MSQSEAARQVGVTKQRINKLVETDRLTKNDKKQVNLHEVLRIFQKGLNPEWTESPLVQSARTTQHAGDEGICSDEDLNEFRREKLLKERAAREQNEFNLGVARGKYLPKQEVLDAMVTSGRRIRQMLDSVPEWADELVSAAPGGAQELRRVLKQKIRSLEQQMADAISLCGGEDDDEKGNDGDRPAH